MDIIVVGIDGSKGAQSAAQWAAEQANQTGARVIAVLAVPRSELWSLSAVQINIDEILKEFKELLDGRWTAPLRKADVEYTTQLARGDPATELLRAAQRARAGAALIALGAKSHSNLADLIVGGTVHKVINRSPSQSCSSPPREPRKAPVQQRK